MKMKLLMESWRKFAKPSVEEGIDLETGTHNGKYYAFDWDDNLLFMPTEIYLKKGDKVITIGTEEFANIRTEIGKPGPYQDYSLLPDKASFRNFREEGDQQFLDDVRAGPATAPAWPDFVKCLNTASIFAIITARGHTPSVMKEAVKILIDMNYKGIDKSLINKSLQRYAELLGIESMSLEGYLGLCRFYPVSYGVEGGVENPQALKATKLEEFETYIKNLNKKMGKHAVAVPKLGFSDDDRANFEYVKERFPHLVVKFTGHGPR
jgi:hypothetical protein